MTASWRSGVRRPRRVSSEAAGDVRCPLGRIPRRGRRSERPGEPRPGPPTATTSGCHRMAQGRGAGPVGESPKVWRGRVRHRCPCPMPSPRTGSAEVEVENRRGGCRRRCQSIRKRERCHPGARHPLRLTRRIAGWVEAKPKPIIGTTHHPSRIAAREGGRLCAPLPVIPGAAQHGMLRC